MSKVKYPLMAAMMLVLVFLIGALGSTPTRAAMGILEHDAIVHPVPQLPIVLDGVRYEDPNVITRFNGQPLYSVWNEIAAKEGALYVFTDEARAQAFGGDVERVVPDSFANYCGARLREHVNYAGDYLELWGAVDMLGWSWTGRISSIGMECRDSADTVVTLYEHHYYDGSWVRFYDNYPNLGLLGWDNRAASVTVW